MVTTTLSCIFGMTIIFSYFSRGWIGAVIGGVFGLSTTIAYSLLSDDISFTKKVDKD